MKNLTPLVRLAQGNCLMLMKSRWSCQSQTWTDIATVIASITFHADWKAAEGFRRMPLSQIPAANPPKQGAAMMSEN
ncbi:Uncharacterised protein [Escherichia coli]|uniref:Uncharacterized protein n=1 Tax=Escherichia coli TaxID=562 RepID=A0A2X3KEK9_ECOLX|nr:Uncharacterised protein [Escherichia coli]